MRGDWIECGGAWRHGSPGGQLSRAHVNRSAASLRPGMHGGVTHGLPVVGDVLWIWQFGNACLSFLTPLSVTRVKLSSSDRRLLIARRCSNPASVTCVPVRHRTTSLEDLSSAASPASPTWVWERSRNSKFGISLRQWIPASVTWLRSSIRCRIWVSFSTCCRPASLIRLPTRYKSLTSGNSSRLSN